MPKAAVIPTRMELTRLKKSLKTATRGHKLLKDKRDELMRQFMVMVKDNRVLRKSVEEKLALANQALAVASAVSSPETIKQALMYPTQKIELEMEFQNIMAVNVPVYKFKTEKGERGKYPYGLINMSGELDDAIRALSDVFNDMLKLAQAEKATQLLAAEIEKTRRRVNALEYVMIPELTENIKYISMKLEENDRSTKVRLIKVKEMVLQDAHGYE